MSQNYFGKHKVALIMNFVEDMNATEIVLNLK